MEVVVEYPITMDVDNVEDMFPSENTLAYQRKKHMDTRHHFICDYVEDRIAKIKCLRSKKNLADPFTNNLSNGLFESLIIRYVHHSYDLKNSLLIFQSRGSKASKVIEEGCWRIVKNILENVHHSVNYK